MKKITLLTIFTLTLITALSAVALASNGVRAAVSKNTVVTVSDACSFTSTGFNWVEALSGGTTVTTESKTKSASVTCNNPDGFVIKAVGNPDTDLSGSSTGLDIATGTSGANSYWAFKVTSATSSATAPTTANGYSNYSNVPATATPIISYPGSTTAVVTGTFRTDYTVSIATSQAADTYTGGVEYTIIPN